ncbi:MAG TPA: helix-turn-helix transcriptional regulator [Ornithinibacter sp.]|jgi:transcriptional regulator with XRE-family HTH domain|uniref:helix-turn-helix domain-containing protein n=1 Tax=Ornithinibacter sp. TaxID=2862748 RepID=UPI001B3D9ACD|nr:helix-turn-helix transcriptional regulator [Ornithinibacter sp.]MBP6524513.1 helix-turn-helix transcriptional regulator [Dermatophilaceae bacterium]HQV82711.1 helix-turn-helix transcriptional regulator [Ornithinibacter sp.]HQW74563.1 helix-turn-helix transcriptional regulator [Ornithinibacter sp.]HQX88652.1 helix-turn-helix transcriptional regulator [Ornithinibacter sp.]HQZ11154.1 helix-turn-helix transcriptional regulator [Ornithinibacter sp.]
MPAKPTPVRVQRAATEVGEHLGAWRRMLNLTAVQVAERANISRDTLRRLEHGDPAVSFGTVLAVARALGALDRVVDALDPFETDLGRARASAALPKRVRH